MDVKTKKSLSTKESMRAKARKVRGSLWNTGVSAVFQCIWIFQQEIRKLGHNLRKRCHVQAHLK